MKFNVKKSLKTLAMLSAGMTLAFMGGSLSGGQPAYAAAPNYLTIKGSDTMVHLVTNWAEALMNVNKNMDISVTGGGSGTGIAALINGTTDICTSSRDMKNEEKAQAKEKGITPQEIKVALDGIAVIVNPSNPINELTMEQIRKIYTGEYTNWKQVGGQNAEIIILSRESSSGTYVFFLEHVMQKKDYTPKARLIPATSGIISATEEDKLSIGYVGLGYANVKTFVDFALSAQGQKL